MTVRAKFTVTGYQPSVSLVGYERDAQGNEDRSKPITQEMRSVYLQPVYGNGNPEHENTKYWQYTPSGSIVLGTVNPAAWSQFEIGKEYYVDFTPAGSN